MFTAFRSQKFKMENVQELGSCGTIRVPQTPFTSYIAGTILWKYLSKYL
jgi:hypothetical protein